MLLTLGAGWTYAFLEPLLTAHSVPHSATTRDGRKDTLSWSFPSDSPSLLPRADAVLVTFPIKEPGQVTRLVSEYEAFHNTSPLWILLGSTGIFLEAGPVTRHSPYDKTNARAVCEDELLCLTGPSPAIVLNLAGLWGGARDPEAWLARVADTKAALKAKDSLHLIHGDDVARGIYAVYARHATGGVEKGAHCSKDAENTSGEVAKMREKTPKLLDGSASSDARSSSDAQRVEAPYSPAKPHSTPMPLRERYILTDLVVYDWWTLALASGKAPFSQWALDILSETDTPYLPRTQFRRSISSREFWVDYKLSPGTLLSLGNRRVVHGDGPSITLYVFKMERVKRAEDGFVI